ncbi:MAG: hydroxymethylbilane synthase [Chthoniobacterales bacterium]
MNPIVRLATRGSDLALVQTRDVASKLRAAYPHIVVEEVIIRTTGDRDTETDLANAPTVGLFTKELEQALIDGRADAAVHSLKDLPTVTPEGLVLSAILPRADSSDVLLSLQPDGLDGLAAGARVGTGSPRRRAMLLADRSDLVAQPIRGNVPTRLSKLAEGRFDFAGRELHASRLTDFLPAPGQGAVAVEIRSSDTEIKKLLSVLHDAATDCAVRAERAVLAALGGGCHMALGAKARAVDGDLHLEAVVFDASGRPPKYASATGPKDQPDTLGQIVASRLHDI